jgi:hypothetical protein
LPATYREKNSLRTSRRRDKALVGVKPSLKSSSVGHLIDMNVVSPWVFGKSVSTIQ